LPPGIALHQRLVWQVLMAEESAATCDSRQIRCRPAD
jgi:hypothetical protein